MPSLKTKKIGTPQLERTATEEACTSFSLGALHIHYLELLTFLTFKLPVLEDHDQTLRCKPLTFPMTQPLLSFHKALH